MTVATIRAVCHVCGWTLHLTDRLPHAEVVAALAKQQHVTVCPTAHWDDTRDY